MPIIVSHRCIIAGTVFQATGFQPLSVSTDLSAPVDVCDRAEGGDEVTHQE